jgi:hypothetical protein
MTKELAIRLLAQWLASWAAEERALEAAAKARAPLPATIDAHSSGIAREREQLPPLLRPSC